MSTKEVKCHYCKNMIKKGVKNCPNCNTVNPSVRIKEVMLWTSGMVVTLYIIGFFIR
jgi:RNA polymerase subunit RPABC4/transcription elongation factor Spt4